MTRAYLAGFGTAGCLLAAAAVLFALATAVVSFSGVPQISAQARVAEVVVHTPDAGATATASITPSHRVLAAFGATRAAAAGRAAQISGGGPAGTRQPAGGASAPAGPGLSSTSTTSATPAPVVSSGGSNGTPTTPSPPTSTPAHSQLGRDVSSVGANLGSGVSSTTKNLNSGVSAATGGLSTLASKLAPNLGAGVTSLTNTVTTVLGNASTGVSTTVSNLSGALSTLLSGGK